MEKAKKTYKVIFCIINSLIGLFTTKFHYPLLDIYGNNDEVYLESFHITDIFIVIAFFIIWYLLLYIVERLVNKYKKDKKVFDTPSI